MEVTADKNFTVNAPVDKVWELLSDPSRVVVCVQGAQLTEIIDDNLFRLTDFKVIYELVNELSAGTIRADKVLQYIKKRENKFWHEDFKSFYDCIAFGAQFIEKA